MERSNYCAVSNNENGEGFVRTVFYIEKRES